MQSALIIAAVVVAAGAAIRSTWSPCGLSMLSSITPMAERGRGYRYRSTAAWFIAGSVGGGTLLGAAMALLAWAVSVIGPPVSVTSALGCSFALGGALIDVGALRSVGVEIPLVRRQVNERWLDQFRNGVYGAGFGFQIGVGFATYIMTSAVALTVVLAALSAAPIWALGIGTLFGLIRGLAVLLAASITSPQRLQALHHRLDQWSQPVRWCVVAVQIAVAGALAATQWWPAAVIVAAVVAATWPISLHAGPATSPKIVRGRRGLERTL